MNRISASAKRVREWQLESERSERDMQQAKTFLFRYGENAAQLHDTRDDIRTMATYVLDDMMEPPKTGGGQLGAELRVLQALSDPSIQLHRLLVMPPKGRKLRDQPGRTEVEATVNGWRYDITFNCDNNLSVVTAAKPNMGTRRLDFGPMSAWKAPAPLHAFIANLSRKAPIKRELPKDPFEGDGEQWLRLISLLSLGRGDGLQPADRLLLIAAHRGNPHLMRIARDLGADVDARDPHADMTALMLAAHAGYPECARLAVELGTDPWLTTGEKGNVFDQLRSGEAPWEKKSFGPPSRRMPEDERDAFVAELEASALEARQKARLGGRRRQQAEQAPGL